MSNNGPKPYSLNEFKTKLITGLLIDEQEHQATLEHNQDLAAGFSLPTAPQTGYKLCLIVGKLEDQPGYKISLVLNGKVVLKVLLDLEGNVGIGLPMPEVSFYDLGGSICLQ